MYVDWETKLPVKNQRSLCVAGGDMTQRGHADSGRHGLSWETTQVEREGPSQEPTINSLGE